MEKEDRPLPKLTMHALSECFFGTTAQNVICTSSKNKKKTFFFLTRHFPSHHLVWECSLRILSVFLERWVTQLLKNVICKRNKSLTFSCLLDIFLLIISFGKRVRLKSRSLLLLHLVLPGRVAGGPGRVLGGVASTGHGRVEIGRVVGRRVVMRGGMGESRSGLPWQRRVVMRASMGERRSRWNRRGWILSGGRVWERAIRRSVGLIIVLRSSDRVIACLRSIRLLSNSIAWVAGSVVGRVSRIGGRSKRIGTRGLRHPRHSGGVMLRLRVIVGLVHHIRIIWLVHCNETLILSAQTENRFINVKNKPQTLNLCIILNDVFKNWFS